MEDPLVSCLMVTANRQFLARRALECLALQDWTSLELVIIDDGEEDYSPLIATFEERFPIRYERIPREEGVFLGELRNKALDLARGDFCIQWDDDEYYHPGRISGLLSRLKASGKAAIVTRFALMHVQDPRYDRHPFRIDGIDGIPGSILHRRTNHRYPNFHRSEDLAFMNAFQKEGELAHTVEGSHWMVRCFHGKNTWDKGHFLGKLGRTWRGKWQLFQAQVLRRDLFSHPAFQLSAEEQASFADLVSMNQRLELS